MARLQRAKHPRGVRLLAAAAAAGLGLLPAFQAVPAAAATIPLVSDPASLVNPLIGTSGSVDTFPGPDMPFGMLQWGPDTSPHRPDGGGYEYKDSKLSGFSLTHISGPGCPGAGDVPLLPVTGALSGDLGKTATAFSHDNERTSLGYYGVTDASGITTELTTTTRAGLGRFTFPLTSQANLLLKLSGGATQVDGTRVQVVNDHEVTGAVSSGHFCGAANRYTLHFDITFDHPFSGTGTWVGSTVNPDAKSLKLGRARQAAAPPRPTGPQKEPHFTLPGRPAPTLHDGQPRGTRSAEPPVTDANGMYLTFDTSSSRTVTAAVGISYTSDDNARLNRTREVSGWDFDAMQRAGHKAWNKLLGRVRIGGGSHDQQVMFYTALYHALLHPNVFSDENGQYMGMDQQVHTLSRHQKAQYANYSGWDTYRSQTQLMAMVAPDVAGDVVTSMLNGYDQTGLLPKWAQNNGESYVMVGDPAAGIIAGARAFGATGFDASHALDALVHEATKRNNDRPGQAVRDAKGYLPIDGSNWGCCNFYGPVSTQLEYDSADYAVASLAAALGNEDVYTKFATRAQDWENVLNPRTGYAQARLADGEFAPGFAPGTSNGFVEGTSAQYTPMVPFNLAALIAARGGAQAYGAYLDSLLDDITDPGPTDADLSNEPSLEIPWEYDYLAQPWKTQAAVRDAQQQLYFNAPVGSFGNDDLGAMSSWYVWSELGMYPETPGTGTLVLGSPVFPRAEIDMPGGRTVRIDAPQAAPDAPYVRALDVNGQAWDRSWLSFDTLTAGATLTYDLVTAPDTGWAAAPGSVPPSDATGQRDVLASAGPSESGLVLAPGATGSTTLDLADIGSSDVTVKWTAQVPSGVTLAAGSGSVTVPAGGKAQQPLTVTAGGTEGLYPVVISLTSDSGADLGSAVLRVAVARPGELWPYATAKGVQPDGAEYTGGFDGQGYAYSEQALAAAGVSSGTAFTVDGVGYAFPTVAAGRPDFVTMAGQTIPLAAPAGAASLGLLGAATNAPATGATGRLTVTYTDGSTAQADIAFSDWTLDAGAAKPVTGNTTAVTTGYRNTDSGGKQTVKTYVFATKIPVDPGRQLASVTLPVTAHGSVNIFAVGFGG